MGPLPLPLIPPRHPTLIWNKVIMAVPGSRKSGAVPCDMVTAVPNTTTRKKEAKSDLRTRGLGANNIWQGRKGRVNVGELARKFQSNRDFGKSFGGKHSKETDSNKFASTGGQKTIN